MNMNEFFEQMVEKVVNERLSAVLEEKVDSSLEKRLDKDVEERVDSLLEDRLDVVLEEKFDRLFDERIDSFEVSVDNVDGFGKAVDDSVENYLNDNLAEQVKDCLDNEDYEEKVASVVRKVLSQALAELFRRQGV